MKSILENIKIAIHDIKWQSETKRNKALDLCISIYNLYVNEGGDFYTYKSLSKEYFITIIKTKSYLYEIKDVLIDNSILEMGSSYDVKRGKGKGYRFNQQLISGDYVALCSPKYKIDNNKEALCGPNGNFGEFSLGKGLSNNSLQVLNQLNVYHICGPKLETYIQQGLQKIEFDDKVNDYINNYTLTIKDILVNDDIKDEYVEIIFDDEKYRYRLKTALKQSEEQGLALIQYKKKCYIDDVDRFLDRKSKDLRLIFKKNIFDINNNIFRVSRNETNFRLDYNLTNMKSNLLDYIKVDGEKLVELDIANSQFSILSYIVDELDSEFIELSQEGKLYDDKIEKKRMFKIAFDKVKKEYDDVRSIFPKTMNFIDNYKKENGYDMFSNLLQRVESKIIIDYVLDRLIDEEYFIFPIHDAFRVKESQSKEIKKRIQELFDNINFKCLLRDKKKDIVKHLYKGFEEVLIERSIQDKETFKSVLKQIKNEFGDISESLVISYLNKEGWNEYKIDYYYSNLKDKQNAIQR
jgi:hypothetical protein